MTGQRKPADCGRGKAAIARHIVLVGMMGAGKTTVGRRLAARLGLPFVDSDAEIEQAAGMSVSELFRRHGEESFRRGEAQIMARLLKSPPQVIATGGGAILHPQTRRLMKKHALSIWLKADLDTIVRRATRRKTRPLLQSGDPRATISRLMEERAPYYAQADVVVESRTGPHARTVEAIVETIEPLIAAERAPGKAGE